MKFIKNQFPNMDADIAEYKKLKEPSFKTLALISIPVGFMAAALLFFICQAFSSVHLSINILYIFKDIKLLLIASLIFVVFNLIIIVVHEFLHALIFPEKLSSDNVVFGVYKMSMFFAFYKMDLKRERMVFCMLFPILLLSILPMLAIVILNISAPILISMALYHVTMSAGDLVGVYLILKNSPKGCMLKNKGYHTYYKTNQD